MVIEGRFVRATVPTLAPHHACSLHQRLQVERRLYLSPHPAILLGIFAQVLTVGHHRSVAVLLKHAAIVVLIDNGPQRLTVVHTLHTHMEQGVERRLLRHHERLLFVVSQT